MYDGGEGEGMGRGPREQINVDSVLCVPDTFRFNLRIMTITLYTHIIGNGYKHVASNFLASRYNVGPAKDNKRPAFEISPAFQET